MYYESVDSSEFGSVGVDLPITPSVALRALEGRIRTFPLDKRPDATLLFSHFGGPIEPPRPGYQRPLHEPSYSSALEYADKIAGRAAVLSACPGIGAPAAIAAHGRMTRDLFAMEHALAMDLGRIYTSETLAQRESAARTTLAVAAYWASTDELLELGRAGSHPLLGIRPTDQIRSPLYDFATASMRPNHTVRGEFEGLSVTLQVVDLTGELATN